MIAKKDWSLRPLPTSDGVSSEREELSWSGHFFVAYFVVFLLRIGKRVCFLCIGNIRRV